jgi:hypothetical protein
MIFVVPKFEAVFRQIPGLGENHARACGRSRSSSSDWYIVLASSSWWWRQGGRAPRGRRFFDRLR